MKNVHLNSNEPSCKEADRLTALYSYGVLDTEPDEAIDSLARIAAHVCDTPVARVSLVDKERQWFKCEIGLAGIQQTSREVSICSHTIQKSGLLVVSDIENDPRFSHVAASQKPSLRFYAGAPLVTNEGLPLGALCVLDYRPRPEGLTPEQSATLLALANAVMDQFSIRRANTALAEGGHRYRALVQASATVVWRATPDGSIIEGSSEWETITGQGHAALKGIGWLDVVHHDDRERVIAQWQEVLASGRPGGSEFRVRDTQGEYRWFAAKTVPLLNADGTAREWIGTLTDIHEQRSAAERDQQRDEQHRALLEASSVVLWIAQPDGMLTETRWWEDITGQDATAASGLGSFETVHPDDRARTLQAWKAAASSGVLFENECRIQQKDGTYRWMQTRAVPLENPDGSIRQWVGGLSDIHDRKQAEEELRASEERLRLALQAGRMAALELDLETKIISRHRNTMDLLGVASSTLSDFMRRVHPDDKHTREQFFREIEEQGSSSIEFRYTSPHGQTQWFGLRAEKIAPNRVVGIIFDIADRKAAEEEIWRSANHDSLTGLPNRLLFQQRLEQALADAKRNGTSVSLLMIDLDDFKDINDTLGHDAGDAILKKVAARLAAMTRKCDTVARLGGDEFAVVLVEPLTLEHAGRYAETVMRLKKPFSHARRSIAARTSIGLAAFPNHDSNPSELIKDADIALYRAKSQGRNRAVIYSPDMRQEIEWRFILGRDVRKALSKDQIVPFYQPKVCLSTGRIVGLEALARWRHPNKGILTPAFFGSAFDDPELAVAMGNHMMTQVASDMRGWLDGGLNFGRVALNLSTPEFEQASLADRILGALDGAKVSPEHLEVEITETVLVGISADEVASTLKRLCEHGVQVALDDFGTGYASHTHLKQFPVNHIKIDQSFVRDIEHDEDDEAIVAAVIGLGKSLKLAVTAEGVETVGQAQRLRAMGCPYAQGYLYAQPVAGSEVPRVLSEWTARLVPARKHGAHN